MTDNLSPEQRRKCMSKNRSKDTAPELVLRSELHALGLRFRKHVRDLPGSPDIVFPRARLVVFVDGHFWHGYRFDEWSGGLSDRWRSKIAATRERDHRIRVALESSGYRVIRVWDHELAIDRHEVVERIAAAARLREATLPLAG